MCVCKRVRVCVCACVYVRACVRMCVCVCVCGHSHPRVCATRAPSIRARKCYTCKVIHAYVPHECSSVIISASPGYLSCSARVLACDAASEQESQRCCRARLFSRAMGLRCVRPPWNVDWTHQTRRLEWSACVFEYRNARRSCKWESVGKKAPSTSHQTCYRFVP